MPGLKSSEALCTITVSCAGSNREQTSTCGITNTSAATVVDLLTLWDLATWNNTTRPWHVDELDDEYTLVRTTCALNRGGVLTSAETVIGNLGTFEGVTPPPQIAVNVQKVTGMTNRKFRGRMFATAGMLDRGDIGIVGDISSGALTTLQGKFDNMYADLATAFSMPPHILHLKTADAATLVTSFLVHPSVGTIRHRKPRL